MTDRKFGNNCYFDETLSIINDLSDNSVFINITHDRHAKQTQEDIVEYFNSP